MRQDFVAFLLVEFLYEVDSLVGVQVVDLTGKPLTLTIKVKTVNTKGNEATCEYIFTDTESGKMLLTVTERTREGRIGSFPNLLGDVIREAGGDFGKFMKRYLKDKKDIDDPLYI